MFSRGLSSKGYAATFLILWNVISIYTVWGTLWRDGYFTSVISLWNHGPFVLPGSSNPILTNYTLVPFFDDLITFSVVLFANASDGSAPPLSLFAFYFTGQWAAILTLIFMEGLRTGNRRLLMSWQVTSELCN